MTEKELHRLSRQDLLQLLLLQSRELESMQADVDEKRRQCDSLAENGERLMAKLNQKDAVIAHLISALDEKNEELQRLRSQAGEAMDEKTIVEIAMRAAKTYLGESRA